MTVKESYTINHYVFNTGYKECITIQPGRRDTMGNWDYRALSLDSISMRAVFNHAKEPEGLRISDTIRFRFNRLEHDDRIKHLPYNKYEAAFYYDDCPFLVTVGCDGDYDHEVWNRLVSIGECHQIYTPMPHKPAYKFAADLLVPTENEEATLFLYNNDCRSFTRNLALLLLTPPSVVI